MKAVKLAKSDATKAREECERLNGVKGRNTCLFDYPTILKDPEKELKGWLCHTHNTFIWDDNDDSN